MRTITNPIEDSALVSATMRTELQTLETEIANTSSGHDHDGTDSKSILAASLPSAIDADKIADGSVSNAEFQYLGSTGSAVLGQSDSGTFTNKILSDDSVYFADSADAAKKLEVELAGATTAKTATIVSSHTDNRSITLPDATDTLVGKATTDTLTNKTLTSPKINEDVALTPTSTELNYVDGVTSAIQTQLDSKVAKATYDAQSILAATLDDTPAALTVGEQTVVGRATGGNIAALAIDSDLSAVSANDDTIPSAKAVKTKLDETLRKDGTAYLANNVALEGLNALGTLSHPLIKVTATDVATFGSEEISTKIKGGNAATDGHTVPNVADGTIALVSNIAATKLDDFATPDANTDLNANTTNHGLLLQATAPAAGLTNVVAIENGETVYKNKALFDATDPTTQAFGDAAAVGTAVTSARRDHKHAMPADPTPTATTIGALIGGAADATPNDTDFVATSLTAAGILKKITWTNVKAFLKTYFDTLYLGLAGGTLTGDIQLGETDIKLDAVLSGDEKWSGITMAGTAGSTVAVGEVCFLAADGKWDKVDGILDGTDTGFSRKLGMCVLAGNDTEATEMLLIGKIRSAILPAGLTPGAPIYLADTAGTVVEAQPSTTNFAIRVVGFAITAEDMLFNPSNDYTVHI